MRTFLYRPRKYSKIVMEVDLAAWNWPGHLQNPTKWKPAPERHGDTVKDSSPLAIFGTLVDDPLIDQETGHPRCIGSNIKSLYAFQLDYDAGKTIEEFKAEHQDLQYSLYTSSSYGIKPGDRFRVVVPMTREFPCELLESHRVRQNLKFLWPGCDQTCFHRGHYQLLPVIDGLNANAKYVWYQNQGKPWEPAIDIYTQWKAEEDAEHARRRLEALKNFKEVDTAQLLVDLAAELREIPVGSGVRYSESIRLLAKYAHKGLGDAVYSLDCPWDDYKWQRQWPKMLEFAAGIEP